MPVGESGAPPGLARMREEYRLVDVLHILARRRRLVVAMLLLALAGTLAATYVTPPAYTASVRMLALEHPQVVQDWLTSRQAALLVAEELGARLARALPEGAGEASAQEGPAREAAAARLQEALRVKPEERRNPRDPVAMTVSVTLPRDGALAGEALAAYVRSLDALRPHLEALAAAEAFPRYFEGDEEAARERALAAARQRTYWVVFDDPSAPKEPSSPHLASNAVVGLVAGLVAGGFTALLAERLRRDEEAR